MIEWNHEADPEARARRGAPSGFLRLPPRVAVFYAAACCVAVVTRDSWSLRSATKPHELRALIAAARGRRHAVEVGTGTAWTAVALALADRDRKVLSLDPRVRPERDRYLTLGGRAARERVDLVGRRAEDAAVAIHDWGNPAYPGVKQATAALGLDGGAAGELYVWRVPAR